MSMYSLCMFLVCVRKLISSLSRQSFVFSLACFHYSLHWSACVDNSGDGWQKKKKPFYTNWALLTNPICFLILHNDNTNRGSLSLGPTHHTKSMETNSKLFNSLAKTIKPQEAAYDSVSFPCFSLSLHGIFVWIDLQHLVCQLIKYLIFGKLRQLLGV